MELFAGIETLLSLSLVFAVALFAGVVKGVVGFAMPMIMISGLTLIIEPQQALAALIFPTLLTNVWQALRQGARALWRSIVDLRVFLTVGLIFLVIGAQLVTRLDQRVLVGLIGIAVTAFVTMQLAGWQPKLAGRSARVEVWVGAVAGFAGGLSGVWGPPTVAYLSATDTPKQDSIRAQGAIYGLGAVALAAAHAQTGVLGAETTPLALAMVPFAFLGLWIGFKVQDRIDQRTFKKATLAVLLIAGLNLIRRGVMG
ncbi:MAG: sulfite exporter TauE/SafE family protein [Pseudomonadota bacterium]